MQSLLLLSIGLPLILALALVSRLRRWAMELVPLVALPALILAALPGLQLELPWVLLGMRLGVDEINAPFLLLAGLLWTASGFYARRYMARDTERMRFQVFYLLTYAGNVGVFLALDAASFYLFFAGMTFAAYGLIVHDGSDQARWAGRVYLVLAVFGEGLLIAALLYLGGTLGNPDLRQLPVALAELPNRDLIVGLLLGGFAIKMGAVPLHVWLALAHPCAPTPASAVLSGVIIKAGLMGWLRFLPLGTEAMPDWGMVCLAVGMFSAFYGVLAGLPQVRPKTVLAYSSISQMGLVTALMGIGLASPEVWPVVLTTVLLFSFHHALAKGALFLGVGVTSQGERWTGWILCLPALALAGAPLTSGSLAKMAYKEVIYFAPDFWVYVLPLLLPLSSAATLLLLSRFLYLAWPRERSGAVTIGLWLPWLVLVIASMSLPWLWFASRLPDVLAKALELTLLLKDFWVLLGAAGLTLGSWVVWRTTRFGFYLPEGDVLSLMMAFAKRLPRIRDVSFRPHAVLPIESLGRMAVWLEEGDRRLRLWNVMGIIFLLLIAGLMTLLAG